MRRYALLMTLAVCSLVCQSASAQSDFGLQNAGFGIGVVDPEGMDATLGFGISADMGGFTPRVRVEPRLDYWSKSEDVYGGDVSVRDVTLGTRVKYYFPVSNPKLKPFAGGGMGVHLLHAEVTMVDPFDNSRLTVEDSKTEFGIDFGGGLATPVGVRTDFVAEVWFGAVSDYNNLSLKVGLTHAF